MADHRKKHNGRGEIFSPRIFQKLYSLARISEFFLHARLLPIFYFLRLETLLANLNIKNLIDTISICKLTNMSVYYYTQMYSSLYPCFWALSIKNGVIPL